MLVLIFVSIFFEFDYFTKLNPTQIRLYMTISQIIKVSLQKKKDTQGFDTHL